MHLLFPAMFTHKSRYILILILSIGTYISTVLCEVYYYFNIRIEWYYALGTIAAITYGIWESNRLLEPLFKKRGALNRNKINFLAGYFIAGSIITTLLTFLIVLLVGMQLNGNTFRQTIVPLKLNLIYAWLANLLFHLLNAIVLYFTEYKRTWMEAEELKMMSAQAELQLIKTQINPHFLFNNLNVLSTLIMQNNAEANRFIEEFSKVYRYILHNHDKELVPLETELHYIVPYIFLLEKRFEGSLKVSLTIPKDYHNHLIVPVALQMLIENAIKHNVVSRKNPLNINVCVNANNNIVVINNLQAKQTVERSTGIGLNNIIRRYRLVSDHEVVINNAGQMFRVELPLINAN